MLKYDYLSKIYSDSSKIVRNSCNSIRIHDKCDASYTRVRACLITAGSANFQMNSMLPSATLRKLSHAREFAHSCQLHIKHPLPRPRPLESKSQLETPDVPHVGDIRQIRHRRHRKNSKSFPKVVSGHKLSRDVC